MLNEYSRECLASQVGRELTAEDVQACLTELFVRHGIPAYLRSENGQEFTAKQIWKWLNELGAQTLFIEPGSLRENGYIESFNGKMRDELLNREIFYSLEEAPVLVEGWRQEYNPVRPHSALSYRAPAPEAIHLPPLAAPLMGNLGLHSHKKWHNAWGLVKFVPGDSCGTRVLPFTCFEMNTDRHGLSLARRIKQHTFTETVLVQYFGGLHQSSQSQAALPSYALPTLPTPGSTAPRRS